MDTNIKNTQLPVVLLDKHVPFPGTTEKMLIGEEVNVRSVNYAIDKGSSVVLIPHVGGSDLQKVELLAVGVIAEIEQIVKHQGGRRMLAGFKCVSRVKIDGLKRIAGAILADVSAVEEEPVDDFNRSVAMIHALEDELIAAYDMSSPEGLGEQASAAIKSATDVGELSDMIAYYIIPSISAKREILACLSHMQRAFLTVTALRSIAHTEEFRKELEKKTSENIEKNQREYYLREQLKVIWEELGEADSNHKDADEFKEKIKQLEMPDSTKEHLILECDRLAKLPHGSNEAAVSRTYIETCLQLPWNDRTLLQDDIGVTERILERDHYGMKKVKERILETVAVMQLSKENKGHIICLAGPPGIGKTSVARSVADALGRNYVRVSLGGVKDEADIRGHRKTYIGAMPGRIIKALTDARSRNPLILLDEIDKLSSDYRGDPSAALLEALDPEQNSGFTDHYIEVPFDLSEVMFITTANDYTHIPAPLLDRMDIIHMDSYTHEEKMHIARRHLIPKQLKKNGMNGNSFRIEEDALSSIISEYTKEAGVRTLERTIASLMRKNARKIASGEAKRVTIKLSDLKTFLGTPKYKKSLSEREPVPGMVNGLAWTSVGGEILEIEVALLPGTGKLTLTGSLGDVMKESAETAVSAVRRLADEMGIDTDFNKKYDIHIHAPEGAVPKDGPSAGITMATAIISALTGRSVRRDIAMTGEITLLGRVLPIGGLREKSMAAYKNGVKTIIIPEDNVPDLDELSDAVRSSIEFIPVQSYEQVAHAVFGEIEPPVICDYAAGNEIITNGGMCSEPAESRI